MLRLRGPQGLALGLAMLFGATAADAQDSFVLANAGGVPAVVARVADADGHFTAQGLSYEIKYLQGGNATIQALVGGSADFAEASEAQFLAAAAAGLDVVAVGVYVRGYPGRLVASTANADLTHLGDFKGKRIGVQFGTGAHTVFMMALQAEGIDPADLTLSNIRVSEMPGAMASDTFDAVLAWDPFATQIVEMGKGKQVLAPADFERMAGVVFPSLVLTTRKTLEERPDLVRKYLTALNAALITVDGDRPHAMAVYRASLPADISADTTDAELEANIYGDRRYASPVISAEDLSDITRTAKFMTAEGSIAEVADIGAFVDATIAAEILGKVAN